MAPQSMNPAQPSAQTRAQTRLPLSENDVKTVPMQRGLETHPKKPNPHDDVWLDADAPEVSTRDPRTLEIRQFFALPQAGAPPVEHHVSIYFYFPRSFGVTSESWTRTDFYQSANVYMRLRAPHMRLRTLANLDNIANPASILRRQLPATIENNAPTTESLVILAQMLGAEVAEVTAQEMRTLRFLVENRQPYMGKREEKDRYLDVRHSIAEQISHFCTDILRALGVIRRIRAKARAYAPVLPDNVLRSLAFAEEYACAVVDENLAELSQCVEKAPHLRDENGLATRLHLLLARTAEIVARRRIEQGFALPSTSVPEHFAYRLGIVKKELQSALYINMRTGSLDPFYRNSAAMIAAGLAATWATIAQISLLSGNQSMLVFGAAVGAYVLKDRIKEWTRASVTHRLIRWDHDKEVVGNTLEQVGLGAFSGRMQEVIHYLPALDLPEHIRSLRVLHRALAGVGVESEQVIHYKQKITLKTDENKPTVQGFGVQKIFRLSLNDLIKRLDEPIDKTKFFEEKTGKFVSVDLPKHYHINIIIESKSSLGKEYLSRVRVVVNQDGIVRIDPVSMSKKM